MKQTLKVNTDFCVYCLVAVDVSQAGEGQLEIMVNRGMVPNTVRALGKGLFAVTFIPHDTRPHIVDILFNSEPIPRMYQHCKLCHFTRWSLSKDRVD